MALPATIVRGATTLTLDRPPIVKGRQNDRGPLRAVASSLNRKMIVQEFPVATSESNFLRLTVTLMSEAQLATLRTLLNGAGPVTVNLGSGSTITAMFADDSEQEFTPLLTDYPECDDAGAALPGGRKVWAVTLKLVRI
jgi:hypothetical protein